MKTVWLRKWRFDLLLTQRRFVLSVLFLTAVGAAVVYMASPHTAESKASKSIPERPAASKTVEESKPRTQSSSSSSAHAPPKQESQTSVQPRKMLPNAIIVGCAKCGTRALLWILGLHPDVKNVDPEMHFFDKDENYEKGLDWYRSIFPPRLPNQIGIEKTPSYFVTPAVPKRIHDMNPSVKLIVIVCEPVRKTVSRFAQLLEHENAERDLGTIVLHPQKHEVNPEASVVQEGMYYQHLQNWLNWFPMKQMLFLDGDLFKTDPLSQVQQVEDFLHIPHKIDESMVVYNETKGFYCIVRGEVRCLGENKGRPHPPTDPAVRQKLAEFFRPHNEMFLKQIGLKNKWN